MRKLFVTIMLSVAVLLPTGACSSRGNDSCCSQSQSAATSSPHTPAVTGARQGQPTRAAEVIYTCPMHPDVKQASPGKCPKCGMDLVQKQ